MGMCEAARIRAFVVGALAGAAVTGIAGRRVLAWTEVRTRRARARAAEVLGAAARRLERAGARLEQAGARLERAGARLRGAGPAGTEARGAASEGPVPRVRRGVRVPGLLSGGAPRGGRVA